MDHELGYNAACVDFNVAVDVHEAYWGRGRRSPLYLLATRKPELRPAARRWLDVLTSMVRHDDEVAFRVFLAGIDGLLIQGLIDDEPPSADELRPVVDYLLKPR